MQPSYKRQALQDYEMYGKLAMLVTFYAAFDDHWMDETTEIWRKAGSIWLAQDGQDNHY